VSAARTFDLYQWHKSLGIAALALTAARLFARALAAAPGLPAARWEGRLAASVQGLTYLLTIVAIASGWLVVSAAPLPVPTRFFGLVVPNLAGPDPALFAAARLAHQLAAWSILGLVALHVAGALKHRFVDRDDVLTRILPGWPKPFQASRARAPSSPCKDGKDGGLA
ncbi:MAG: cytochrome b/b6 domain-containing protein, partial [Hyphomicrobiales bacterium]|nr:cytochrome b/b6 domain-containing protein [Hyphomicrobiales bacterium]